MLHRITDPADVIAYLTSFPPGDSLGEEERRRLDACVREAFAAGGGVLCVTCDTGYLVGRRPNA